MEVSSTFHKSLQGIQDDVLIMGSMVTKAIDRATGALKKRDLTLAHKIIADDAKINRQRFAIEDRCIQLMVTQQPVASDLRIIVAVLNMITELERMGDYAVGIAKVVIMIGDEPPLKPLIDIPRMAELTIEMIDKSLQSFITRDLELAKQVVSMDSVVDSLYDQVFRELLTFMMVDPKTINRATRLIWVAHNLERSADRATNICERVAFTITGKMEELDVSKY
ncbi:MAG: phosphate transport system regulatory protein PhoU [Chloroflexi bacterium CG_4_9_14_3_um_filter_45_9]|nr:MAG: phosphate transport system regulatory protein PhoU [Chloroflexi bacterium CG08_land_8_20_14_0_20_45_12]PIX27833.1 MAG: phosphate transport system regulatory protein PhoU [Chloroflexi bacterium CG_4_8_14_3_um_filter_45_15]PJB50794.1 MAG: phosphate transport system regulatory protein PhoU [Chloroflexi bacterium CG_4_9_14_3_um_filter_45_9]